MAITDLKISEQLSQALIRLSSRIHPKRQFIKSSLLAQLQDVDSLNGLYQCLVDHYDLAMAVKDNSFHALPECQLTKLLNRHITHFQKLIEAIKALRESGRLESDSILRSLSSSLGSLIVAFRICGLFSGCFSEFPLF